MALLLGLVAGDNLLWRLAGWVATHAFVAVGGDIRLDLFEHLSGHGSRYFSDQFPGALAGRVTNAANAAWSIEQSLTWTTIPPAAAVVSSIAVLGLINWKITVVLFVIVSVLGAFIAWLAARGLHLHARFAGRAAAVSGDLTDVVSNIGLVRAFGAARRERTRLSRGIATEMSAQRKSLRSLERLRLFHAVAVFLVTAAVLGWSVTLWREGRITTGDVVLTTTLGFTVLHASRDLAMALVELVQHFAKLGEAVHVLGLPHEMVDAPDAKPLIPLGGAVSFVDVSFSYPDGDRVLENLNLEIQPGQKVGLVGRSGAGKSTILSLLQRLYDPTEGRVLIDGQDIAHVTQDSLRRSIAVVHQDISLFHRSVLENLRYGRPGGNGRGGLPGDGGGVLHGVRQAPAAGLQNHRRRARPEAFRGAAAADRHRPRLPERRADHPAGRSDLRARYGVRAVDPGSVDAVGPGANRDRGRPSLVDARVLRPDHRSGVGTDHRRRSVGGVAAAKRPLQPDVPASAGLAGMVVTGGGRRWYLRRHARPSSLCLRRPARADPPTKPDAAAPPAAAHRRPRPRPRPLPRPASPPPAPARDMAPAAAPNQPSAPPGGAPAGPPAPAKTTGSVPGNAPSERGPAGETPAAPEAKPAEPAGETPAAPEAKPAEPATEHPSAVLAPIPPDEVTGILGEPVRGPAGEDMGMIVDVLVDAEGHPRAAVIDFGGFLGVGSRKIAVDWQELNFRPADRAGRVLLSLGRAEVQAAPEYKPKGQPAAVVTAPPPERPPPESPPVESPPPAAAPAPETRTRPERRWVRVRYPAPRLRLMRDADRETSVARTESTDRATRAAGRGLDWLNLFVANVQTGFGPFIAVYLTTAGWTQTGIGLALSVGTVAAMASQVPAGALVDRVRRKSRVAVFSILSFTASALFFTIAPIPLFVYLAQVLHAFSSCTLGPAIVASQPRRRRSGGARPAAGSQCPLRRDRERRRGGADGGVRLLRLRAVGLFSDGLTDAARDPGDRAAGPLR